jgi:hypothetical protein
VSGQIQVLVALLLGKQPHIPINWRLGRPKDRSHSSERRKTIVFPHPETNPHLQLHTIVTNSAFVYCLLRMGK